MDAEGPSDKLDEAMSTGVAADIGELSFGMISERVLGRGACYAFGKAVDWDMDKVDVMDAYSPERITTLRKIWSEGWKLT